VIFSIRDFVPADQDAVRSLILEGLADHWGAIDPSLNTDLDDIARSYGDGRTVVGVRDGRIVATGTVVRRNAATAEIMRMSVDRTCSRDGLGRAIVGELIETARGWGMDRVILETSSAWTDVVGFYLGCGFAVTHTATGAFGDDTWFELPLAH
jgi:putative acetyltransferase